MKRAWAAWVTVAGATIVGACGDDAGASGVEADKTLSETSEGELGQLCDWSTDQFGGYGATIACSDGSTVPVDANREECVTGDDIDASNCAATVTEYEACILELAKDPCAQLQALASEACAPLLPCFS